MLVMFGISMALLVFGLIAVALDLSELYAAHVRVYDAAEQAALTATADIEVCGQQQVECGSSAQLGRAPTVNPCAYDAADPDCPRPTPCQAAGDNFSGVAGSTTCRLLGVDTVEATVTARVHVVIPVPGMGGGFPVTATYAAVPVLGAQRPVA